MTEQISRRTQPDVGQQGKYQGLFRAAEQAAEDRPPVTRSTATTAAARPSCDVFSHACEYDVAEQRRPATHQHDEVALQSLQLSFEAETDIVDVIDQQRSVPIDEDDYR
jgi:hypothetical protein